MGQPWRWRTTRAASPATWTPCSFPRPRYAAEEISAAHELEPDWPNDAAKGFLPGPDEHPRTVFESDWLLVQVPSPEYLLAMKLHASRDHRDLDDAATLFTRLGYTTAEQAVDLLSHTYPAGQLLPRHYYIAADVAKRATNPSGRRDAERHASSEPPSPPDAGADRLRRAVEHEKRQPPGSGRPGLCPPDSSTSRSVDPPPSRPSDPPGIGF